MPFSDFFGVEPVYKLAVKARLQFGGALLELRPLTLEQVFSCWDLLGAEMRSDLASCFMKQKEPDDATGAALHTLFDFLHPEHPEAYLAASDEEVAALFKWYMDEHQWLRIFEGVFGLGKEPTYREPENLEEDAIDNLYLIEVHGGRTIESLLSMRVEAYLSYEAAFVRDMQRRGSANGAPREYEQNIPGGKRVTTFASKISLSQMFDALPGEIEFFDPTKDN